MKTLSLVILFILLIPTLGIAGVLLTFLIYWLGTMYIDNQFYKRMATHSNLHPSKSIFPHK